MKENNVPVSLYILRNIESDHLNDVDINGANALDWYCRTHTPDTNQNLHPMTKVLSIIHKMQPELVDKKGKNAIICGCYGQEKEIISVVITLDEKYVLANDKDGKKICDYLHEYKQMDKLDCFEFYAKYPKYAEINGISPFFYQCRQGDGHIINKLLTLYPNLIYLKDPNKNILDYYIDNRNTLTNDSLLYLNKYLNKLDTSIRSVEEEMTLFLCVASHGDLEVMKQLFSVNAKCIDEKDKYGNGFMHYLSKHFDKVDCFEFYEIFPQTVKMEGLSPFFYHCNLGNKDTVTKLMALYPNLIHTKDEHNKRVWDYKNLWDYNLIKSFDCIEFYRKYPNFITVDGISPFFY
eukprot:3548_1